MVRAHSTDAAHTLARITAQAAQLGGDDTLTDEQIDAIAHHLTPAMPLPLPDGMHDAVRAAFWEPLTDDDPGQTFAEAAMSAANGVPFRYSPGNGRTVLLVPVEMPQ